MALATHRWHWASGLCLRQGEPWGVGSGGAVECCMLRVRGREVRGGEGRGRGRQGRGGQGRGGGSYHSQATDDFTFRPSAKVDDLRSKPNHTPYPSVASYPKVTGMLLTRTASATCSRGVPHPTQYNMRHTSHRCPPVHQGTLVPILGPNAIAESCLMDPDGPKARPCDRCGSHSGSGQPAGCVPAQALTHIC